MERALFEKLYNKSIEEIAKNLCEKHKEKGFRYVRNFEGVYEAFLNQWHYLRWLLKNETCSTESLTQEAAAQTLLDDHKTGAAITAAISQVRIVVNENIKDEHHTYDIHNSNRLNEQVAILCGISYLISNMLEDPKHLKVNDSDAFEILWPDTCDRTPSNGGNKYLDSLIRGVYYSSISSRTDPILLAHIYFLIEQYHRKSVELEQLKLANA